VYFSRLPYHPLTLEKPFVSRVEKGIRVVLSEASALSFYLAKVLRRRRIYYQNL